MQVVLTTKHSIWGVCYNRYAEIIKYIIFLWIGVNTTVQDGFQKWNQIRLNRIVGDIILTDNELQQE